MAQGRRRGKWIFIDDLYCSAGMRARGRNGGHQNRHYQLLLEHALEAAAAFSLARALFPLPPRSFLFGSAGHKISYPHPSAGLGAAVRSQFSGSAPF